MKQYHHLNQAQRYQIEALLGQSIKPKAIALQLGRHVDTIQREIKRSTGADGIYRACQAQTLNDTRTEIWGQVFQYRIAIPKFIALCAASMPARCRFLFKFRLLVLSLF